jgi:hypothetical protein
MASGFSLVLEGSGFDPRKFLQSEPALELPWRIIDPSEKGPSRDSTIELSDIQPGCYPLDLATEVLDLLSEYRSEIERCLTAVGVDERTLNLYDEEEDGSLVDFRFSSNQLLLLGGWGINLNVEAQHRIDWSSGSRLLRR